MKRKHVTFNVSFNYGAWELRFEKTMLLDFAPFYGMFLFESNDDMENLVELANNEHCKTMIIYRPSPKLGWDSDNDDSFDVDVRNVWRHPVTDETVDITIEIFERFKWERRDNTDIVALKELMSRDYQKQRR